MRLHSQNLNDGKKPGSMLWYGRAWLRRTTGYDEICHIEWEFGRRVRRLSLTARFGAGESEAGVVVNVAVPFLFSIFLCVPHVYRCTESEVGVSCHLGGIHLYTFTDMTQWHSEYPWWKRSHSWYWPWELRHYLTEILEHKANLPGFTATVWDDSGKTFMGSYAERKAAEEAVSETYDYTYTLKNGNVQHRKATVHVTRMTWRARWWPLIPIQKSSTHIDVQFNDEVGEGTGSWKGGVVGCSHELRRGETPLECLRRMEQEVKFAR